MTRPRTQTIDLEQVLSRVRFQDLAIFAAVARLGSVAATSRERKLNPPLISKSLKKLERAVGTPLFVRSTQGFLLTPEGAEFLEFYRKLSGVVSGTQSELRASSHPSKLVTIAGVSFLVTHLLSQILHRIPGHGSKYRFRILTLSQDQLVSQGIRGNFDIAVHTRELGWPGTWNTVPVGSLSWILCARAGHPLGRVAQEKSVRRSPFIFPTYWSEKGFRRGDDRCPMPVKQRLIGDEVGTAEMGLHLAAHTDQLIFVPDLIAKEWVGRGQIQSIEVSQWAPVRDGVSVTAHSDRVSQRLLSDLTRALERQLQS